MNHEWIPGRLLSSLAPLLQVDRDRFQPFASLNELESLAPAPFNLGAVATVTEADAPLTAFRCDGVNWVLVDPLTRSTSPGLSEPFESLSELYRLAPPRGRSNQVALVVLVQKMKSDYRSDGERWVPRFLYSRPVTFPPGAYGFCVAFNPDQQREAASRRAHMEIPA